MHGNSGNTGQHLFIWRSPLAWHCAKSYVDLYDSLVKEHSYFHFTDEEILLRGRITYSRIHNMQTLQCKPWVIRGRI